MKIRAKTAVAILALVFLACACSSKPNAPTTGPAGRPLVPGDSRQFVGNVTPTVFFRYLGWTNPFELVPTGTSCLKSLKLNGRTWLIAAANMANTKGCTVSAPSYMFSVMNHAGASVQLIIPRYKFVFHQQVGVHPYARLQWQDAVFYNKNTADDSIFSDKITGSKFKNTAPAILLQKYVERVDIWLTPAQSTSLSTAGTNAAPVR